MHSQCRTSSWHSNQLALGANCLQFKRTSIPASMLPGKDSSYKSQGCDKTCQCLLTFNSWQCSHQEHKIQHSWAILQIWSLYEACDCDQNSLANDLDFQLHRITQSNISKTYLFQNRTSPPFFVSYCFNIIFVTNILFTKHKASHRTVFSDILIIFHFTVVCLRISLFPLFFRKNSTDSLMYQTAQHVLSAATFSNSASEKGWIKCTQWEKWALEACTA